MLNSSIKLLDRSCWMEGVKCVRSNSDGRGFLAPLPSSHLFLGGGGNIDKFSQIWKKVNGFTIMFTRREGQILIFYGYIRCAFIDVIGPSGLFVLIAILIWRGIDIKEMTKPGNWRVQTFRYIELLSYTLFRIRVGNTSSEPANPYESVWCLSWGLWELNVLYLRYPKGKFL